MAQTASNHQYTGGTGLLVQLLGWSACQPDSATAMCLDITVYVALSVPFSVSASTARCDLAESQKGVPKADLGADDHHHQQQQQQQQQQQ